MLADDPRLSPLWAGRRAPFQQFQDALGGLAGAYDLRDGRSDDPTSRVSLSTDDWHGCPIVPARRFPVSAFDDLLLAVQLLAARQRAENRASGWTAQVDAERRAARWECWQARGTDPDTFRAGLRDGLAESARLYGITPNDLI
ncbi:hypothetical protein [Streptomyces massasporeus]|uniref:hypothetical protein n=1 Tax=Streptomyces massasporeus TaxID=67324 RepID=UPI0016760105|nr:hypothetical protein [Streptomyces massasporeus]GGV91663.1 hypothetical protein GCM10010228_82640 [Streptomyces massasporeus]